MKKRTAIQGALALLAITLLCWVAYGLSHPPKARPLRYQGVNTVRNASVAHPSVVRGDASDIPVVFRENVLWIRQGCYYGRMIGTSLCALKSSRKIGWHS